MLHSLFFHFVLQSLAKQQKKNVEVELGYGDQHFWVDFWGKTRRFFFRHQNIKFLNCVGGYIKWIKLPALVQNTFLAYKNTWAQVLRHVPNTAFSLKVATLTLLKWCPIITPLSSHNAATHNELICINVGFICPFLGMPLWFRLNKTDTTIT